jgi:hypothetical protein
MVNGKVQSSWSVRPPTSTVTPGALQGPIPFRRFRDPRPWSQEMRSFALSLDGPIEGLAVNLPDGMVSQPAPRTKRDWETRIETLGHSQAFRHTGNRRSEVLQGFDLVLLAIYVKSYPDSTGIQKITFLWDAYGRFQDPPRFYDESQITRAEQRLGLSRKKKATDAFAAHNRINLLRRHNYWTLDYPGGIADIRAEDILDCDEAKIMKEHCNQTYAKATVNSRCRTQGHYGHGDGTLILACISGGPDGQRWLEFKREGGTDVLFFLHFIQRILVDIGPGTPGDRKCFTFDNLLAHHHALVLASIVMAGHRYAFRSPYWPQDGPIEYWFNVLENILRQRGHLIANVQQLENHIRAIFRQRTDFQNFFFNVGFTN